MLDDNPSLKPYLAEALGKAHRKGIELASGETDLPSSTFPSRCPYSLTEILDAQCATQLVGDAPALGSNRYIPLHSQKVYECIEKSPGVWRRRRLGKRGSYRFAAAWGAIASSYPPKPALRWVIAQFELAPGN